MYKKFLRISVLSSVAFLCVISSTATSAMMSEYYENEWMPRCIKLQGWGQNFTHPDASGTTSEYSHPGLVLEKPMRGSIPFKMVDTKKWPWVFQLFQDPLAYGIRRALEAYENEDVRNVNVTTYCPIGLHYTVMNDSSGIPHETAKAPDYMLITFETKSKVLTKKSNKVILQELDIEIKKQQLKNLQKNQN